MIDLGQRTDRCPPGLQHLAVKTYGKNLTKRELFAKNVREKLLSGEIRNNVEMLEFSYSEGHLGSHADEVLREMKKLGDISYDGVSPLVTYDNVFKSRKIISYTIPKK